MEFKFISNSELIQRLEKLVRTERKITHLVLLHIAEVEERKVYADLGFDGMYSYLTRGLGYSEGSAYRRLQSARLLKQVPAVAGKIEDGSLNLSQLTQVQKCLKESARKGESVSVEYTLEVLTKLENKNSFETQKTLALELNLPIEHHQKVKPQQDESVRIEITLTKEQFAELEQAKNFLSHICPDGNLPEIIATLAKKYNQSKVSSRKATPIVIATGQDSVSDPKIKGLEETSLQVPLRKSVSNPIHRQYISVHNKRSLLSKAQHRCEYKSSKTHRRCESKYKLEIDHRLPIALGGTNEYQSLRVLCQTHNALAARQAGLQ
ncbi:MAG: HNH endonuclease [Bdellovibrio sp.]